MKKFSQHFDQTVATAVFIAIIPPLWAVISPKFGIETGAVALICAGIFTAEGNHVHQARKITLGLLIGIPWGITVLRFTSLPGLHALNQFLILCVLGAVIILICGGTMVGKYVDATAWLVGWAITILVLGHEQLADWHWLPLHLALSMIVGVYLIGVGGQYFNNLIKRFLSW